MNFTDALYDGSDPLYAPCTGITRNTVYWKCPARYRRLGYTPTSVRLPGTVGDGRDAERAREARKLTRDMVAAFTVKSHEYGTWPWLIHKYLTCETSPFQRVKANTKEGYVHACNKWQPVLEKASIDLTYEDLTLVHAGWQKQGKSLHYIKDKFGQLRRLAGYGKMLRVPGARDLVDTLSEMRFQAPPARSVFATATEVRAIIAAADARGSFGFSAALLIQWTYMLRPVDVRGHWLAAPPDAGGGIRRNGRIWRDGLTWDMVAPDLTSFVKVISKTEKTMPEPMRFEITPEIRTRLRLLSNGGRVGPVILNTKGVPFSANSYRLAFNRFAKAAGVREELCAQDIRPGAVTEAKSLGVSSMELRDAAQHKNVTTTDRYARGRSESAAKVVHIRAKNSP